MNEQNRPAYYAIIPSSVRYCEELKFPERLLYGEITALTGKEGYCFATNKYFAELYGVSTETISRWISHLSKYGFISIEIIKNEKNEIIGRKIYITDVSNNIFTYNPYCQNNQYPYPQNNQYPYCQNNQYPIDRNVKYNNINIRIDRLFNYIINKESENPEDFTEDENIEFWRILQKLEFDYTEDILQIFTKENIEKLKIIIYALKELYKSNKRQLISRVKREDLIFVYDNCKNKQIEYKETTKEINNFFEYYYISLIKSLEKSY